MTNPELEDQNKVEIQINGQHISSIELPTAHDQIYNARIAIAKELANRDVIKIISVPHKLVNFVVNNFFDDGNYELTETKEPHPEINDPTIRELDGLTLRDTKCEMEFRINPTILRKRYDFERELNNSLKDQAKAYIWKQNQQNKWYRKLLKNYGKWQTNTVASLHAQYCTVKSKVCNGCQMVKLQINHSTNYLKSLVWNLITKIK